MSRKIHRMTDQRLWQGTGEEIHVLIGTDADARRSVLQFFAVCAYPQAAEERKRDLFARAYDALLCKIRILGKNKHDATAMEKLIAPACFGMENQQILGAVRRGMKRLEYCLAAGKMAASSYFKGYRFLYPTAEGVTAVEMAGYSTDTEMLRDWLRGQTAATGRRYDRNEEGVLERDAIENARELTLHRFAPVLHLGLMLFVLLEDVFDASLEMPYRARFRYLTEHPRWLPGFLLQAEALRVVLQNSVPCFNPDKAVHLLPAEPVLHRWRIFPVIERNSY